MTLRQKSSTACAIRPAADFIGGCPREGGDPGKIVRERSPDSNARAVANWYYGAMNKMLERAWAAISKLPDAQQEAIAANILDDLEAERGWEERFAKSQDSLSRLSKRAGERITEDTTLPFDPSNRPEQ